jgi:hypothetical protein
MNRGLLVIVYDNHVLYFNSEESIYSAIALMRQQNVLRSPSLFLDVHLHSHSVL